MMDNSHKPLGTGMIVAASLILLLLLTAFFDQLIGKRTSSSATPYTSSNLDGRVEVTLKRAANGHYVADGFINDHPVRFFVDTGATIISIPQHIAERMELKRGAAFSSHTANGVIESYATRLQRVRLGGIELHNILAGINPHTTMDEVLLGMSFLKYVEFSQRGDELILRL
jgi:aspartyl protease family protein